MNRLNKQILCLKTGRRACSVFLRKHNQFCVFSVRFGDAAKGNYELKRGTIGFGRSWLGTLATFPLRAGEHLDSLRMPQSIWEMVYIFCWT